MTDEEILQKIRMDVIQKINDKFEGRNFNEITAQEFRENFREIFYKYMAEIQIEMYKKFSFDAYICNVNSFNSASGDCYAVLSLTVQRGDADSAKLLGLESKKMRVTVEEIG